MPINLNIPGEMTEQELRAIEQIAAQVPPGGVVVEVGSYLGLSSWTWAKSVHPTVTIYCIDPWERYRDIAASDRWEATEYGIEAFRRHVSDCPNIVALKGYSPRDFLDWDQPVDVYFEDAVHKNPILAENLRFWSGHLKPGGIICGHDFLPGFLDVVREVESLARQRHERLITVRSIWCLVPEQAGGAGSHPLIEAFTGLDSRYRHTIEVNDLPETVRSGSRFVISGTVRLTGTEPLSVAAKGSTLRLGAKLYLMNGKERIRSGRECRAVLPVSSLQPGEPVPFSMECVTTGLRPGQYQIEIEPLYERLFWFSRVGVTPFRRNLTIEPRHDCREEAAQPPPEPDDERFWRRHVPEFNPDCGLGMDSKAIGIITASTQTGAVDLASPRSVYELAALYSLAREQFTGRGDIVVAGDPNGLATLALARGLASNTGNFERTNKIWFYDPFVATGAAAAMSRTGSIFEVVAEFLCEQRDAISFVPGDISSLVWRQGDIGILCVGTGRSMSDFVAAVRNFFPHLIAGESFIVLHDYFDMRHYGRPIAMHHFGDHFEFVTALAGSTAIFRCLRRPEQRLCDLDLSTLPLPFQRYHLESAIEAVPVEFRDLLRCASVRMLLDQGAVPAARAALAQVSTAVMSDDPMKDCSLFVEAERQKLELELRRRENPAK